MQKYSLALIVTLFSMTSALQTQPDDAALMHITNLEQMDAIRHDLNGDERPDSECACGSGYDPIHLEASAVCVTFGT